MFQLQFITLWKNFATLREKFETLTPWLNIYLINLYLIKFPPSSLKGFLKFSNCDLISYISSIKTTFIVFIWAANAFNLSVFGNSIKLLTNQGRFPWEISLVFRSSTRIINEDRAFPATFRCVWLSYYCLLQNHPFEQFVTFPISLTWSDFPLTILSQLLKRGNMWKKKNESSSVK